MISFSQTAADRSVIPIAPGNGSWYRRSVAEIVRGSERPTMKPDEKACPPSRARSRVSRGRGGLGIGVAVALFALLVQTGAPHLHQWLTTGHATPERSVATAHDPGVERSDESCDDAHSACPTCRVLAQSRVFAVSGRTPARSIVVSIARPDALATYAGVARRPAHAPRSPPRPA